MTRGTSPDDRPRVLVVDDEVFIARAVGCLLADARGARVEVAASGDEALPLAEAFRPHLILVDVRMPGMPPRETCQRLRDLPCLGGASVYLLTGLLPDDEAVGQLRELVGGVIGKPPDPREVISALDQAVARTTAASSGLEPGS